MTAASEQGREQLAASIVEAMTLSAEPTPSRATSLAYAIAEAIIAAGWKSPEQVAVERWGAAVQIAFATEARAETIYPRDIWPVPSKETYVEINALLQRERGHMLDCIAADMYRRAHWSISADIRDDYETYLNYRSETP